MNPLPTLRPLRARPALPALVAMLALLMALPTSRAADAVPEAVAAAVADKARPERDTARDADRKPEAIMALSGLQPGGRAVDVGPGGGYYLRIMSRIVGPSGKVFAVVPSWQDNGSGRVQEQLAAFVSAGYSNVAGSVQPIEALRLPEPVDLVFMSQIYHDQVWKKVDLAQMNRAIFDALRPGGVYLVIDHVGAGVTSFEQIDKVHRIDPAAVKAAVLAAGFELAAESDLLRNPADPGTLNVFSPAIRGRTDQFVLKFRKPAKG